MLNKVGTRRERKKKVLYGMMRRLLNGLHCATYEYVTFILREIPIKHRIIIIIIVIVDFIIIEKIFY